MPARFSPSRRRAAAASIAPIEPHAHIICTSCSRVIDVPLPFDAQLDAKASEQIGWHVTSHYTIFEGLCPDCR